MARPLRIEYEGAWYHVMNRGIDRQMIYRTTEHRNMFLDLLKEITNKYFIEIHAYCLMDNHYHLLIRTPFPNLGRAMRHLNGVYTMRFNISEKRDGAIFRGRYHAILIEEEQYLLQVSRYIHLNPVSAKICINPSDYPWSSYHHYTNKKNYPEWLSKNTILTHFGDGILNGYKKFIAEGIDDELKNFYKHNSKTILGNKRFISSILTKLTEQQKIHCQPSINLFKHKLSIEIIIATVNKYFNIETTQLLNSKRGKKNIPRLIAIFIAKQYGQLTHQKIASVFTKIQANSISTVIKRFEILFNVNSETRRHVENICCLLRETCIEVT